MRIKSCPGLFASLLGLGFANLSICKGCLDAGTAGIAVTAKRTISRNEVCLWKNSWCSWQLCGSHCKHDTHLGLRLEECGIFFWNLLSFTLMSLRAPIHLCSLNGKIGRISHCSCKRPAQLQEFRDNLKKTTKPSSMNTYRVIWWSHNMLCIYNTYCNQSQAIYLSKLMVPAVLQIIMSCKCTIIFLVWEEIIHTQIQ